MRRGLALGLVGLFIAVVVAQTTHASATGRTSSSSSDLSQLAQQQTNLLLKFYEGQNVSPLPCGRGQSSGGIDGVFLLPTLSFGPGDRTINCQINARSVLVDLGGFAITEDRRFPESSYVLNGQTVPFTPENLEPICDDLITNRAFADPTPATLDGNRPITGTVLDSGLFTARVNRHAQIPGGVDYRADSVAAGHPGRLATVFCGSKAKVHLSPGRHTIMVDYGLFPGGTTATVFTYNITVRN